ncbi:MAG TPA: ribose-phosphate pyrophosphokinase [Planctomycetota bacterium]|nr:ribose-phosphate pyrophosphokinase [Planctomycetota bacterium]
MANSMKVFSGTANRALAERMCEHLNLRLGEASVTRFPDGEVRVKIEEDVRGADVFVLQPTCPPVNDNLMELVLLIDAFKRASAERITAVVPYFGYARQDRKDEGRVPISAKLVSNMIVQAGASRVLALDLHAAQIQGFFDIPVDHLYASPVLSRYFRRLDIKDLVVVAPDVGSSRLARGYAKRLNAGLAIVDKRRVSDRVTEVMNVIGDVKGRGVLLIDDMISTGSSITQAAKTVHDLGAKEVYLAATHALLCGNAMALLDAAPVEAVVVTDTIPLPEAKQRPNLRVLSVARLLGEAILRIHHAESVSRLFQMDLDE